MFLLLFFFVFFCFLAFLTYNEASGYRLVTLILKSFSTVSILSGWTDTPNRRDTGAHAGNDEIRSVTRYVFIAFTPGVDHD